MPTPVHVEVFPFATPPRSGGQLEPIETPVDPRKGRSHGLSILQCTPEQHFRHSGWLHRRSQLASAIERVFGPENRIDRFRQCGSHAWVCKTEEEKPRYTVQASHCKDRWCVPCQRQRAKTVEANLEDWIDGRPVRLVTLTLRHTDQPLSQQLDLLYKHFRQLRQRQWWRHKVRGGIAVCEVKRSKDGQHWHPHLHVVCDSKYLDEKRLSDEWKAVTRTSWIVDVRAPRPNYSPARYLTKYLCKPMTFTWRCNNDLLDEALIAFNGRRMLLPFGTWFHAHLTKPPPHVGIVYVMPLETLLTRAQQGDADASLILKALRKEDPCTPAGETRPRPP